MTEPTIIDRIDAALARCTVIGNQPVAIDLTTEDLKALITAAGPLRKDPRLDGHSRYRDILVEVGPVSQLRATPQVFPYPI